MANTSYAVPRRSALLWAVITAGGCGVISLWWFGTASFSPGLGNELTNAGRVLGLLGGYLLAVLLMLMARVPILDRYFGSQHMARVHAMIGKYVVMILLAHACFVAWGYAATVHRGVLNQVGTFWMSYPDVLAATVALDLLIIIGAVSARAAKRRLAYETWYLIHFYTYLAVALAFAHQFAVGDQFSRSAWNRIVWIILYGIAGTSLLMCRVALPIVRAMRYRLRVDAVVAESNDVVSIYLKGRRLEMFGGNPGQFLRLRFLTKTGWWQSHPYSLSAVPNQQHLRVTVKAVGDHTKSLADIPIGTAVFAEGPYGSLTSKRLRQSKVLLVAGGVGITPLRTLFETVTVPPGNLTLIYRVSTESDLVFRDELDSLARHRTAKIHYLVGPRGADAQSDPVSAENLRTLVPDLAQHDVYLCGPVGLVRNVATALAKSGVRSNQIHIEQFAI